MYVHAAANSTATAMRHASIQTTMNVYGQAMPESKREANGKVVTMVLKPLKASA